MRRIILLNAFIFGFIITGYSQDLDFDLEQGEKAAKQVAGQMKVDTTSITAKFIADVGNHLVSNLEGKMFDYKFHLIDAYEPNAFALPGGYIYVTRGILLILNNEDELGGIMGHEVIHSHNRHSYKAAKKQILPSLLKAPGKVVGLINEDLGKIINAPIELTSGLRLAKYGRSQETEADTEGVELAAKSGYDPLSLAEALTTLSKGVEYVTGKEEKFSYFNDHPFTPERVDNINEISQDISISDQKHVVSSRAEFLKKIQGITIGEDPAQGVINGNRFYHADLDLDLTFPEEWVISNNTTHVAATSPDKKAQVYMLIAAGGGEPRILGEAFINKFKEKYRVESYRAEEYEINGYPAFAFGVNERSGRDVNNSTIIWVKKDGITYQFVGAGLEKYEENFNAVAGSIKSLTEESRAKVIGIVLEIAQAKEGETIEEFGARTGNVLKSDFTALINDIDAEEKLTEGEWLKIGVKKLYQPAK